MSLKSIVIYILGFSDTVNTIQVYYSADFQMSKIKSKLYM